jgi:hypothetical protein
MVRVLVVKQDVVKQVVDNAVMGLVVMGLVVTGPAPVVTDPEEPTVEDQGARLAAAMASWWVVSGELLGGPVEVPAQRLKSGRQPISSP